MTAKLHRQFADIATYSDTERTAVSVRDGVLEYLGAELGLEPADHVFNVYRSPATIANAAYAMAGIPLTGNHVSLDGPAPSDGKTLLPGTDYQCRCDYRLLIPEMDE